jgi:hypothetical protein
MINAPVVVLVLAVVFAILAVPHRVETPATFNTDIFAYGTLVQARLVASYVYVIPFTIAVCPADGLLGNDIKNTYTNSVFISK